MKKWFGLSLGLLLGISHVGMIGMISQGTKFPKLNLVHQILNILSQEKL